MQARNFVIMRKAVRKDRMENDETVEAKRLGGSTAMAEGDIADRFYRCSSIRASQNIALRASARYHTGYRTKSSSSVHPPVSSRSGTNTNIVNKP